MYKLKNIVFFILLIISPLPAFSQEFTGVGEAVLGNGTTLEEVQFIAEQMSKRDALEQFGVYLKSETKVNESQVTSDEIKIVSSGLIKQKNNTKIIKKYVQDDSIILKVTCTYEISDDQISNSLKQYIDSKNKSPVEANGIIDEMTILDSKLVNMSKNKDISSPDVQTTIKQINNSISRFNTFVNGITIYNKNKNQEITILQNILSYLQDLKEFKSPYDFFELNVKDDPTVSKDEFGNFRINIKTNITLNKNNLKKLRDVVLKYKNSLYPDGNLGYLTKNISNNFKGSYGIIATNWGMGINCSIVFLNSKNEIISIVEPNAPYYLKSFIYVYSKDLNNHLKELIKMDKIPSDYSSLDLTFSKNIPDEVLKNTVAIKFMFLKYDYEDFKELYNYTSNNGLLLPRNIPVDFEEIEIDNPYATSLENMSKVIKTKIEEMEKN